MSVAYAPPPSLSQPWLVEQSGIAVSGWLEGTAALQAFLGINDKTISTGLLLNAKMVGQVERSSRPLTGPSALLEGDVAESSIQSGLDNYFMTASQGELPPVPGTAVAEMEIVRSLAAGWEGPGSLPASEAATGDAYELLSKMASDFPEGAIPSIGLDSDGVIVMSWNDGDLVGSLSVQGDGTYSYYIERDGHEPQGGEAKIAAPLPRKLVHIMQA